MENKNENKNENRNENKSKPHRYKSYFISPNQENNNEQKAIDLNTSSEFKPKNRNKNRNRNKNQNFQKQEIIYEIVQREPGNSVCNTFTGRGPDYKVCSKAEHDNRGEHSRIWKLVSDMLYRE